MKYKLNLDTDGRVLSVTYEKYGPPDMPSVDVLPSGDVTQYRYVGGGFVYDPVPEPESTNEPTLNDRVAELEEALELILSGVTE